MKRTAFVPKPPRPRKLLPAVVWLVILWAWPMATNAMLLPPNAITNAFRLDRILVKPRAAVPAAALENLHRANGNSLRRRYPEIGNLEVVQPPAGRTVEQMLRTYRQSGLVEYAEPDYILSGARTPNESWYSDGSQWALYNWGQLGGTAGCDIDAAAGWDLATDASSVLVSVIDSGARVTHQDLAANLWINPGEIPGNGIDDDGDGYIDDVHGINTIDGTGNLTDEFGHGTHVAGILGAVGDNGVGMVGAAWKARMMICKFLDPQLQGSVSDAIECINYSRSKGAKIVNASWGGKTSSAFSSQALHDAIDSLRQAGIIFVAAAGNFTLDNDDSSNAFYPASFDLDNIISVAATTRDDGIAHFSDCGLNSVDLGAPGYIVLSCWSGSDSDYRTDDGTSMAAPHVAAACALAWTLAPNSTYQQIIQRVLNGVDQVPALAGKCRTGGRLNLYKVLSQPSSPPTGTQPVLTVNRLEDGKFYFRISGTPNSTFELQTSSDLKTWSTAQTLQFPSGGSIDFWDEANLGAKYYRAMLK